MGLHLIFFCNKRKISPYANKKKQGGNNFNNLQSNMKVSNRIFLLETQ